MAGTKTLTMIKPDAVRDGHIGAILNQINEAGFRISALKLTQLSQADAEAFYAVHSERPFFGELVAFMTSGPIMVQVLEGEDAVKKNREIMGATNPADALAGTLRSDYAESIDENAVHGSDAPESAAREIAYFFADEEICPRTR